MYDRDWQYLGLGHFRGTTIGYNISKLNCAKGRIYSSFVTMEHSPKL